MAAFCRCDILNELAGTLTDHVEQSRDIQLSSAIGKPPIINNRYCDIKDLSFDDFDGIQSRESFLFVVEQVKLADICESHVPLGFERLTFMKILNQSPRLTFF